MNRIRVYVAGALSHKPGTSAEEDAERGPTKVVTDYIQNLAKMCQVSAKLREEGFFPYMPGMDILLGLVAGTWEEDMYREIGMAYLEVCEAVYVLNITWGVNREIERAEEFNIPVFYSLGDLYAFRDREND